MEKELAKLKSSIERLVDAVESTGISPSLQNRLRQRESERGTLEARIQELSARERQGELRVSEEVLEKILRDLERRIRKGDTQDVRAFLQTSIKRIEIDKARGKVLHTFPFGECGPMDEYPRGSSNSRTAQYPPLRIVRSGETQP
jgi:hypothetical protein